MKVLAAGAGLTVVTSVTVVLILGPGTLIASAAAGLLATMIQVWAVARLQRGMSGTTAEFLAGFGAGALLRLGGVVVVGAAIGLRPEFFPPVPTAAGFLGVLLPLLLAEARLAR
jgi:hypothetical protein